MKSNLKFKMAIAASGLLASGAAFAGAPISFDQFTVTAGTITDTSTQCNVGGWTCVNLDATGVGILTQQVTDPVSGISYLRSINVEADAEGAASTLAFSNEVQIYASGLDRNNVALKQRVIDDPLAPGMTMTAEIYEGAFRSDGTLTDPTSGGGGAEMNLFQSMGNAGGIFQQQGVNGNIRQRIDQNMGGTAGKFTYATAAAAGTNPGLYEPTAAGSLGGTVMPVLAYNAGDALAVVWVAQNMPTSGALAGSGEFGFQEFRNLGAGGAGATPVATSERVSNDGTGFVFTSNGPWDWPVASDPFYFDLGGAPTPP